MQFPQKLLALQLFKGLFGKIVLPHADDRFMQGRPIDFLDQSFHLRLCVERSKEIGLCT